MCMNISASPLLYCIEYVNLLHVHTHTHSLQDILSTTPTSIDATYTLGLVYQDLKVPHRAKEMFMKTLQLDPEHKHAKAQLASFKN